jgi:hypothetical protein
VRVSRAFRIVCLIFVCFSNYGKQFRRITSISDYLYAVYFLPSFVEIKLGISKKHEKCQVSEINLHA